MHFSKFWLQKNYVPDIAQDPFGRETAGIEVTFSEGENIEDAKIAAREFISDYIKANKIESPHITDRYISEEQLPEIQKNDVPKDQNVSLEDMLNSVTELKVLESYCLIVKNNPTLQHVYDVKKKQLVAKESQEIIERTNAHYSK